MSGRVDWYGEDVSLRLEEAAQEVIAQAALRIEAHAKVNIRDNGQIDTGFMLNSVYVKLPETSTYGQARAAAGAQNADGSMAPEVALPQDAGAAVVVGAAYAIFQEAQQPFLYPAVGRTQREMGGIVERVKRNRNL